jgi:hypothetical protein
MRGIMFLVLWSVISSDSNVTEVYVEAEETATFSTSVTPSSTRWVGGTYIIGTVSRERQKKYGHLCVF